MTTFKEIRGTAIESVSSDPSNPEVGQIWYNNTIGVLKGNLLVAAAWASGGNMATARSYVAGCGTQTEGLVFGGLVSAPPAIDSNATEEYNGTSWGPGVNLNTARRGLGGTGTQTAAIGFGGYTTGSG